MGAGAAGASSISNRERQREMNNPNDMPRQPCDQAPGALGRTDPEAARYVAAEYARQRDSIELIAS